MLQLGLHYTILVCYHSFTLTKIKRFFMNGCDCVIQLLQLQFHHLNLPFLSNLGPILSSNTSSPIKNNSYC
ncbi:unnamed protein product, partial [Vitis vinifera]|uniref:Uncharacterized protein n=1 Tax=Vitis vinifera TaxID=29760 RepID=D7SNM8_VITVI